MAFGVSPWVVWLLSALSVAVVKIRSLEVKCLFNPVAANVAEQSPFGDIIWVLVCVRVIIICSHECKLSKRGSELTFVALTPVLLIRIDGAAIFGREVKGLTKLLARESHRGRWESPRGEGQKALLVQLRRKMLTSMMAKIQEEKVEFHGIVEWSESPESEMMGSRQRS